MSIKKQTKEPYVCLCICVSITLARNHTVLLKGFPAREQLPGGWPSTSSGSTSTVSTRTPEDTRAAARGWLPGLGRKGQAAARGRVLPAPALPPGAAADIRCWGEAGCRHDSFLHTYIHLHRVKSARTWSETSPSLLQSCFPWRELHSVPLLLN